MRILIIFFIVLGSVCNAELRTWTSIVGTKVEAELVSLTGNQVTLKTKVGKTLKLPLNKLSKADQEFLKAKSSPKEPTKEEAPVNPNLKYEVKDSAVTITGCDKKVSGALTIPVMIEGKSVTSIGKGAFVSCTNLTSITIGDSVTSIGKWAFRHCGSLTSITIGASVTSIGERAFYGCIRLTSITIPDGVTSIGVQAFYVCTKLTSITIGNGVTSIEEGTFAECRRLTSITISDSVTSIGPGAFINNTSLTSITIPDGVTSIGGSAFISCTDLRSVTFLGNAPKAGEFVFLRATPTIYRKSEANGWGETWGRRPVKLISEKP